VTDPRVAAVEGNLIAQFRLLASTEDVRALPDEDVIAYTSDVPFPLFNGISGARFAPGSEARRTAEVVDRYLARGLPFLWWATPSTMTPQMDAVLRSRGLAPSAEPGMHVPLTAPLDPRTPPGVEVAVSPVTPELVEVMTAGFGFPDFVSEPLLRALESVPADVAFHVIARLEGEPVSAGSVFRTAATAGIYNIATVGSARRRGLGYAVTATLMNVARERGCTEAVLMASTMGRPTYERLGFVEVCQMPQYVWVPESG
jgi:GNAT superfamily N-acetyltransferase